ncbi:MAG: hypothetical protein Q9201_001260 [Fulgogasparrea decipioides]
MPALARQKTLFSKIIYSRILTKLKCSGDSDGCERCKATSSTCTYLRTSSSRDGHKRRPRRTSSASTRGPYLGTSPGRLLGRPNIRMPSINALASPEMGQEGPPERSEDVPSTSEAPLADVPKLQSTSLDFVWDFPPVDDALDAFDAIDTFGPIQGMFPTDLHESAEDVTLLSPTPQVSAVAGWNRSTVVQQDVARQMHRRTSAIPPSSQSGPALATLVNGGVRKYIPGGCQCQGTMVQLLEDMGEHGHDNGVDSLLMYLGRGVKACEEVLMCPNCEACYKNGMLFATVAQHLSAAATSVASKLSPVAGCKPDRINDVFEGAISLGCYRIEMPKVRFWFVYNTALDHLAALRTLLSRIEKRARPKSGAGELLADAEDKIIKSCCVVQQCLIPEVSG